VARGDSGPRHQRTVCDHAPVVDRDRRDQLARREARHQVPRSIEVGVHVAQVVVLVEKLGDRLRVAGRRRPHLDVVRGLVARRCAPGDGVDVVHARPPIRGDEDVELCRQPLPVRTEVRTGSG